jgi:hypothetical protein
MKRLSRAGGSEFLPRQKLSAFRWVICGFDHKLRLHLAATERFRRQLHFLQEYNRASTEGRQLPGLTGVDRRHSRRA